MSQPATIDDLTRRISELEHTVRRLMLGSLVLAEFYADEMETADAARLSGPTRAFGRIQRQEHTV